MRIVKKSIDNNIWATFSRLANRKIGQPILPEYDKEREEEATWEWCPKCGNRVWSDEKVCSVCGEGIELFGKKAQEDYLFHPYSINLAEYEEFAKGLTDQELHYAIADAVKARDSMDESLRDSPELAGSTVEKSYNKYADQVNVLVTERYRRQQGIQAKRDQKRIVVDENGKKYVVDEDGSVSSFFDVGFDGEGDIVMERLDPDDPIVVDRFGNKKALFVNLSDIESLGGTVTDRELLRLSIIAELDAVNLYEKMAKMTTNQAISDVMSNIAAEEKTHVGEFEALLKQIDMQHTTELEEGAQEVAEIVGEEIPEAL